ncbi:MAG: hypothetical protein AVO38_14420 [delta proteobacterium ML8_D]|nr:MAG: hypothetical protein AVO38_14420 [delta proteobacterium ML8_D]
MNPVKKQQHKKYWLTTISIRDHLSGVLYVIEDRRNYSAPFKTAERADQRSKGAFGYAAEGP